jgi:hypothetical protein
MAVRVECFDDCTILLESADVGAWVGSGHWDWIRFPDRDLGPSILGRPAFDDQCAGAQRNSVVFRSWRDAVHLPALVDPEAITADEGWLVLVMIGVTVAACLAFDFNPRVAYYLPLLPSVLISAICFGFGTSLFTVIASIMAADFLFAPPVFDFAITEWEDVLGLATFGIIGALVALAIDEFFAFPD